MKQLIMLIKTSLGLPSQEPRLHSTVEFVSVMLRVAPSDSRHLSLPGVSHALVLVCVPSPQVVVQDPDTSVQLPQIPGIVFMFYVFNLYFIYFFYHCHIHCLQDFHIYICPRCLEILSCSCSVLILQLDYNCLDMQTTQTKHYIQ